MLAGTAAMSLGSYAPSWTRDIPSLETVRAELARRELLEFIKFTKRDYIAEPFHATLCKYLDRVIDGDLKRLMVFAPPQHGKSEIVSRRFPAYAFGKKPTLRIIGSSYSHDLAARMNRDVQRIMDSDEYRSVFPGTIIPEANNRTQARGALRNSEIFEVIGTGGSYRPAGRGEGITGMSCDLAILDDPVKGAEEAFSPTVRAATWEWYTRDLTTRMSREGAIVLTMTRWARDDLAGMILNAKDHGWTVLTFPAFAPDLPGAYDERQPGEPLCPSRFNKDDLELTKTRIGPLAWSAMYEQNPRPEGAQEFPPEWFGPDVWFDQWPGDWIVKVIALDPSKGKEHKTGDYGAFVEAIVSRDGRMYVDAQIGRWNTDTLAEMAVDACRRFNPDAFGCETLQFQELLADNVDRIAKQRSMTIRTTPLADVTKKYIRIRRLTPYLAKREIRFKANSPGTKLLVEQLQDFPNGAHDDGPDALEMAVRLAHQVMRGTQNLPEEYV